MTNQTATTTTNIEIIPQRISCSHYKTQSFTNLNKVYDQNFDYDLKRWNCNCPDFDYHKNLNCKHIILLRAYIKREKAQQAPEQHSTSIELVNVLSRISALEVESANLRDALYKQNELAEIKDQQITILQDRLRASEMREPIQQKQIDNQADLIGSLQTSVCRLNELTINQDEMIKKLAEALDQQGNMIQELILQHSTFQRTIDDQTQQINKLREAVSSQQTPAEQVVRIIVDQQTAARATRQNKAEQVSADQPAKRGRKANSNNIDDIEESISFMSVLKK